MARPKPDLAELMRELERPGPPFQIRPSARLIGCSMTTAHALVKRGLLQGYKLPGVNRVVIERQSLRDYLALARSGGRPEVQEAAHAG